MPQNARKKRVPKLKYTELRGIGWHVTFRDPETGTPRRHRFGKVTQAEAEVAYYEWVASHLKGEAPPRIQRASRRRLDEHLSKPKARPADAPSEVAVGSLLHVTSGLLTHEESRVAADEGPRPKGAITRKTFDSRRQFAQEFLKFINSRYGQGAVGRMMLADLKMEDVEEYNRLLVDAGYSSSQVNKRLRLVKSVVDRAGRPEHASQLLPWNWGSRDVVHGKPAEQRRLPTLRQLKLILQQCDAQRTAMVWMAIGCGFGQRDLAQIRIADIDEESYDLRRGKTGIERYGETPPLVWSTLKAHLGDAERGAEELVFRTEQGMPVVHGNSDSVQLWWARQRTKLGKEGEGLGGFYTLRHLGATAFGSREGCSIGEMKRWLGHSASSQVADVYMKPVAPENRPMVQWVNASLALPAPDLRLG